MVCNNLESSCVRSGCGHAWTPRRDFAVSKSVTQSLTVGSVAFQKAGADRVQIPASPGTGIVSIGPGTYSEPAISEALGEVLTSPKRRQDLGQRARERSRMFSWRQVAEQTVAVYEQVASGK